MWHTREGSSIEIVYDLTKGCDFPDTAHLKWIAEVVQEVAVSLLDQTGCWVWSSFDRIWADVVPDNLRILIEHK